MGKIKRYKNIIEKFLSGESGQRFFNFAYSIGAAVVIWGALFKILHLPGGNTLLSIGMGTEVLMFILSAFDRPSRNYNWEQVFPVLDTKDPEDRPDFSGGNGGGIVIGGNLASDSQPITGNIGGGTVYVGAPGAAVAPDPFADNEVTSATKEYLTQMSAIAEQMQQLKDTTQALNEVSSVLLDSYRAITENSENITASSHGYVEQMQNLNRNISGLNTIYEIQLRSVSSQLDAIDRVNRGIKEISSMYENSANQSARYCEESEKMAYYMQQLNNVYAQMLQAMTINMYHPMPGNMHQQPQQPGAAPAQPAPAE